MNKITVLFSLYMLAFGAYAETESDVSELYRLSGLKTQVEQFREVIKTTINNSKQETKLSDEERKAFAKVYDKVFEPQQLQPVVMDALRSNLQADDIKKILAWLRSPTGQKITQVEAASTSAEGYQDMLEYAQTLASNPPDEAYINKMSELAGNTNMFESAVNMALKIQLALMASAAAASSDFSVEQFNQLAQQLQAAKPAIAEKVTQITMLSLLYTYKDLPATDLDPYIAFTATPVGRKFNTVTMDALNDAMVHASKQLGVELVKLGQDMRKKQKS